MTKAFQAPIKALEQWVMSHPNNFPPIVINLTDGAYTDGNPANAASELKNLHTTDGNLLLFNCHISDQAINPIQFPSDNQAAVLSGFAEELFQMSSLLPSPMLPQARAKINTIEAGARGYAFNADLNAMVDFFEIGTRTGTER